MLSSYFPGKGVLKTFVSLVLFLFVVSAHAEYPVAAEYPVVAEDPVAAEDRDPYESFNRVMYSFNDKADRYLLKPVAKTYNFVMPEFADQGVTNFFNNLSDVSTFANSLLQAKFHNAAVALSRVIWNSTFGLGGLIDVATHMELVSDDEDLGQTLAVWGYENSNYLVLPFLGPSTVRDTFGRIGDTYSDPLYYWDELSDQEKLLLTGLNIVDKRSDLLAAEGLLGSGGDPYVFLRNAYLQNRNFLIKDGEVEDEFANEEIDFENF
jgi:phospholipid-binding lipoprotein MlaA